MNVLSLFDGISCGKVALDRLGIKATYFASEIDPHAIKVSKKNHPDIIRLGDVTNWKEWELPKIDLILAGSPCQGFSVAGKGLNFDDPRSKLFFTFVDILKTVKPEHWLLENVSMQQPWVDTITEYVGVEPKRLDSAEVSAQSRKRLYWASFPIRPVTHPSTAVVEDILEAEVDPKYLVDPKRAVVMLDHEVSKRKIAYIGNDRQANRIYSIHGKSVTLIGLGGGMGAKTGIYALPCMTVERTTKAQNGRRFRPPSSKFYTLTSKDNHGILTNSFIRRLTPVECERLQTLPDNYTYLEGLSDTARYKMLDNGWTVDMIKHILGAIT